MSRLKSVGIVSWAEMRMFMAMIVNLIIALVFLVIGFISIVIGDYDFGVGLLILSIFLPLVVIIFSFFVGLIEGLVFNVACSWTGGLEINVDGF